MAKVITLDDRKLQELIKAAERPVPTWIIEDGVEYGVHQEFTNRGHPSLVPAFERNTKRLPQAIRKAIEAGTPLEDVVRITAFQIQSEWAADVNVDTGAYRNSIKARKA